MRSTSRVALRARGACCVWFMLAGCSTALKIEHPVEPVKPPENPVQLPPAGSGRGGYYKDDGPGEHPPPNLEQVPDAQVRLEPYLPRANKAYVVFGKTYTPITDDKPFTQRGIGSWYGKKFHGQRTASGELYDMYKMSAAHPTLPIPSYARLTSIVSGKQVIVRINDRGPFHAERAIDVSYTAALKLGLLGKGSHELLIERLLPADIKRMKAAGSESAPPLALPALLPGLDPLPMPAPALELMPVPAQLLPAEAALSAVLEVTEPSILPTAPVGSEALENIAASGFYVQLGAFSVLENVAAMRLRLAAQTSVFGALEIVQVGSIYRLYSAPFVSREAALKAVQALPVAFSLKPIVVQR